MLTFWKPEVGTPVWLTDMRNLDGKLPTRPGFEPCTSQFWATDGPDEPSGLDSYLDIGIWLAKNKHTSESLYHITTNPKWFWIFLGAKEKVNISLQT